MMKSPIQLTDDMRESLSSMIELMHADAKALTARNTKILQDMYFYGAKDFCDLLGLYADQHIGKDSDEYRNFVDALTVALEFSERIKEMFQQKASVIHLAKDGKNQH